MSDKQVIQWLKSVFGFGWQSDLALHSSYWAVWQSPARVCVPGDPQNWMKQVKNNVLCRTPEERGSGFAIAIFKASRAKTKKSLLATHLQKYTCNSKWYELIHACLRPPRSQVPNVNCATVRKLVGCSFKHDSRIALPACQQHYMCVYSLYFLFLHII